METAVTSELLGHQVQITTDDGIYKGLVKSFNASLMKLTLYKVFSCNTNKPLHGLHHFYEYEIKECLVLSEQQKKGKILKKHPQIPEVNVKSHKHFKDYEKNCGIKTRHLGQLNFLVNCGITDDDVLEEAVRKADRKEDSDYTIHCKNKQIESTNVPLSEEEEQHFQPPTLRFQLSADFVVIDEIGDSFFDAVNCVKKQGIIGVSMEPGGINRTGELCWLTIGTRDYIFLFDIFSLGKQAFQQGLKEIIESLSILKVIHGCYLLSDVLFHQYDTNLLSVFDTQIGDVLVQRQENEKLQCQTRHLNSCLTDYLQLSDTDICVKWFSQDFLNRDNEVWKQRPLPPILHEAAVKHVIYLRELRVAVMEKLLTEFTSAVNSSLSLVRDMSHEELDNNAPFSVTVPLILSNFQSKPKRKASLCPKFLPPGNVHQEDKFLSSFSSQKELNIGNYSTLWKSTNMNGKNHIHQKMEISNKKTNFERQWRKKQKCDEGRKTGCGKANKTLSSSSPSVTENQELIRTSEKGLSSKNGNIQQKEANGISNHTKMKKVLQPSVSESESPSSPQCVRDLKNLKISNKEEAALPSQKQCSTKYFTLSSSNRDFVPLKDKPSDTVCNSEYGRYQKENFWPKVKPSALNLTIIPAGMQQELKNSSTQATVTNNDKNGSPSKVSMRSKLYLHKNYATSTSKGYAPQSRRNCTSVHSFTGKNENTITVESDHVYQSVGVSVKSIAEPQLPVYCHSSKNLMGDSEDFLNRVDISTVTSKSQSVDQQSDAEEQSSYSVKQLDIRNQYDTSKSQSVLHNSSSEKIPKDSINDQANTKRDSMSKTKSILYGTLEALLSNRT